MHHFRRAVVSVRSAARWVTGWSLSTYRLETGASASALNLLHGLGLVSLAAALPGLLSRGSDLSLFAPFGVLLLVASWTVRVPRPHLRVATDAIEAGAILCVALGMEDTWQAVAMILASLWYRSLRSSAWEVAARIGLYTTAVAVESVITTGDAGWDDLTSALMALPFWVGTAIVSRRMGLMLIEHDAVSEIVAVEATLSADVVGELDTATLAKLARASWHDLCDVVPGLRIVRMELRERTLCPLERAGSWRYETPPVVNGAKSTPGPWDYLASSRVGLTPRLDDAAGEQCRWGLGPQLDADGVTRVLVGIPAVYSARLVNAVTAALERTELLQQHARDHALLGVQARTDDLTGLSNRLAFFDTLAELEAKGAPISLLFVDLDAFKEVNDTHGHSVGDEVLHGVALRLLITGAGAATVARLGGDEFGLLYDGGDVSAAVAAGEQAEAALLTPIVTSAGPVRVGLSWGVSMVENGDSAALLAQADAKMYRTKRSHRTAAGRERRQRK